MQNRSAKYCGRMEPHHFNSIEEAVSVLFRDGVTIADTKRIYGGDINDAYGLTLTDGNHIFMKVNTRENASFFAAEATGLDAVSRTGAIGTPRILGYGTDVSRAGGAFLLLEFVYGGKKIPDYWEIFGHQLADMHRAQTADYVHGGKYGFLHDNYIGAGNQINTPHENWITFFRDCRLKVQFQRAAHYFDTADFKKITRLMDHIGDFLAEPEYPSLLHGDLWGGNVITGNDGRAWLIDPAVYVGHAEADIAMTELFGGFPAAFYSAYREAGILLPDYKERRDLYNLYHLLNHLNLFGRSYLSSVKQIIGWYAS